MIQIPPRTHKMPKILSRATKITKITQNLQIYFEIFKMTKITRKTFKITKITLKPSKEMDVLYMKELLEKRISHGLDYIYIYI